MNSESKKARLTLTYKLRPVTTAVGSWTGLLLMISVLLPITLREMSPPEAIPFEVYYLVVLPSLAVTLAVFGDPVLWAPRGGFHRTDAILTAVFAYGGLLLGLSTLPFLSTGGLIVMPMVVGLANWAVGTMRARAL